jgi:hypothetical protein
MIAVCVKEYITNWRSVPVQNFQSDIEFKKGMQFDVQHLYIFSTDLELFNNDSVVSRIKSEDSYLYNFKDNIVYLPKTHFMLLDEWREQQINKLYEV